jgi:mono/diheme cytochrome c family protein
MRIWNALYLDDRAYQPVPGKDAEWNRGAYLVRGLTHCSTCHTPRGLLMSEDHARELAGGTVGPWEAPNITSDAASGIGGWGVDELVGYLQTGHASGKSQAAGPMAEAVDFSLRHLTSTDLRAIAAYLKTVPPVHDARDERPAHAWGQAGADLAALRGLAWPRDPEQLTGSQLYDAYCATCHQAGAEGSFDGGLPPLFHNTALGRTSAANLVLVILDGLHRQPDVFMPGFRGQLSDHQLATLAGYLTQRWGNPKATVSAEEVRKLRDGASGSSHLRTLARAGLAGAIVVLAAIVLWLARGTRRRTSLRQTT